MYCPVLICLFFFTFISVLHRCAYLLHPPAHRGSVYPPPKFCGNLIFIDSWQMLFIVENYLYVCVYIFKMYIFKYIHTLGNIHLI